MKAETTTPLTIVCISDTHCKTSNLILPHGDILLHAGDFTKTGLPSEILSFNNFLSKQPFKYKLFIAGNHDLTFDTKGYPSIIEKRILKYKASFPYEEHLQLRKDFNPRDLITNAIYMEDSGVIIEGRSFYGTPWTPERSLTGFKLDRRGLKEKWKMIPKGVDVLLTHTPPFGILDRCKSGSEAGCEELLTELERIQPKYHVFGHIHDGYGIEQRKNTVFLNASTWCKGLLNEPLVFTLK